MGVLSSWVTALMKLSCCSFRRISRSRKIVLRTSPVVMAPKKITPRKTLIPSRQLRMIQPKPTATATPARPTPSTRKVMVALRRLVMRMERFYREDVEEGVRLKDQRRSMADSRFLVASLLGTTTAWICVGARPKPTLELEPLLSLLACAPVPRALRDTHGAPAPIS